MNLIRFVLFAQLAGCAFCDGNTIPDRVAAPVSSAEIARCFFEGAPVSESNAQPDRTLTSEACSSKYQFVEATGTCVKPAGVRPFISQGTEDIPQISLRCIDARITTCEPDRRYRVRGAVRAVVDRRKYPQMDCMDFGHDTLSIAGCREAQAETVRVVFQEGCVVTPL